MRIDSHTYTRARKFVMDSEAVINALHLQPHIEGGYFRRTYTSQHETVTTRPDGSTAERKTMTSIFYLLTTDSQFGHTHKNRSDIMLYYHLGLPICYLILFPDGKLEETILGPDLKAGQKLQLFVPGGTWLSTALKVDEAFGSSCYDFGLVSEAVTPGFDYSDMTIATVEDIKTPFPEHWERLKCFVKPSF